MTTEALKSTQITNLDATPPTPNTPSTGGECFLRAVDGSVTTTDAATSPSTYQLCRIPTTARLKHAWITVDSTVTTLTADVGFYYSDSTVDGTPAANQGTKVNGNTGSQLLGAAQTGLKTKGFVDYASNMTAANRDKQLWDACGLTKDPGGYFDLVLTTTATNSGSAVVYAELQYTE